MGNDDDERYFLEKVIEELESEGQDLKRLGERGWVSLRLLAAKIAARLRTTIEKVLDALERIVDMFGKD